MTGRILVTGAAGQLGQCIQKIASQYNDLKFVYATRTDLDITDAARTLKFFENGNFDFCINAAAYTNVEQAEKTPDPAYNVNSEGVKNIAKACATYAVRLIHISTDYVFDGKKDTPYTVVDATGPINAYGASKLAGENHIQELLTNYLIIRTSWLYSEYGSNFYKTIVKKAATETLLHVTDKELGSPTDANNLAKYILELINSGEVTSGIEHFTDGEAMTWYDFAKKILKKENLEDKVKIEKGGNYRSFAPRPNNSVLKVTPTKK